LPEPWTAGTEITEANRNRVTSNHNCCHLQCHIRCPLHKAIAEHCSVHLFVVVGGWLWSCAQLGADAIRR
jgi:hypothetical protein